MRRYAGMDWSYLQGAKKRVSDISPRREGEGSKKDPSATHRESAADKRWGETGDPKKPDFSSK